MVYCRLGTVGRHQHSYRMYCTLVPRSSPVLATLTNCHKQRLPTGIHCSLSRTRLLPPGGHAPTSYVASRGILTKFGVESADSTSSNLIDSKQANDLAIRLTAGDRKILISALQDVEARRIRDEYEGQLAAHRWRSKFGRPSKVPKLGDVDPTGTYCAVPDDWLNKKYAAKIPNPSNRDLFHLAVANSIPFIGFGFLDNFIMIVAGDYIDHVLGSYICLSTMAAAALGNTFSDVAGIGSAFYVERFAERIGFQPPKLSPIQLDMKNSRRASNLGRVLGITLGCLLGMLPLLFISDETKSQPEKTKL